MDTLANQLLTTLVALAFVSGLAWVCIAMLKRLQQGRSGGPNARPEQALRFVRALPVGAKERVVVVHYRGEEMLLGVTGAGISLLSKQPIDVAPPAPSSEA